MRGGDRDVTGRRRVRTGPGQDWRRARADVSRPSRALPIGCFVPDRQKVPVKRIVLIAVGVLLVLAGVVWMLQGLGTIGGSSMSGQTKWALIGPIVAVIGIGVAVVGLRTRGPQR